MGYGFLEGHSCNEVQNSQEWGIVMSEAVLSQMYTTASANTKLSVVDSEIKMIIKI